VDFTETGLIRTPFFHNILYYHIAAHIEKIPNEIILRNNELLDHARTNDTIFNYVGLYLINFYRNFCKTGFNNVYIKVAERLLTEQKGIFASDTDKINKLKESIQFFNASNIGQKAYFFKALSIQGDSLSLNDVKSKFKLLFFWNTGCGHCETAANALKEHYSALKNAGCEVFAFAMEVKDLNDWKKKVQKNEYNWINVCDFNIKYLVKEYYYVCNSPQMFVIDENGAIINKLYGEDQIGAFAEQFEK
jgi:peroxiredoxin